MNLIRLTVGDLGFPNSATTEQILDRAIEFGLDFCPPEVGPYYRLQYTDQPMGEWVRVGMKPFSGRGGNERVFRVGRDDGGLWLGDGWTSRGDPWDAGRQFMFRLRK